MYVRMYFSIPIRWWLQNEVRTKKLKTHEIMKCRPITILETQKFYHDKYEIREAKMPNLQQDLQEEARS